MMADDTKPEESTEEATPAEDIPTKAEGEPAAPTKAEEKPAAPTKAEEKPAAPTKAEEEPGDPSDLRPAPDPETCKGIAIGLDAFWEGVHSGEWDDSTLEYYLEPAGILNGPLRCARCSDDDPQLAGLLMSRASFTNLTPTCSPSRRSTV